MWNYFDLRQKSVKRFFATGVWIDNSTSVSHLLFSSEDRIFFRLKLYSFSSFTTYNKHVLVTIKQLSVQKRIHVYITFEQSSPAQLVLFVMSCLYGCEITVFTLRICTHNILIVPVLKIESVILVPDLSKTKMLDEWQKCKA